MTEHTADLRDRLAAIVLTALDQPSLAGYRLPKRPSDLAYTVADAILAAGWTRRPRYPLSDRVVHR